jgi:hypothetical protein
VSDAERRKNPRYPVNLAARLASVEGTAAGKVRDICRDAAFFESPQSIPVGTAVELGLEFPGLGTPLAIKGKVVREAHTSEGAPAVAILFIEENPEFVTQLDFLIDSEGQGG